MHGMVEPPGAQSQQRACSCVCHTGTEMKTRYNSSTSVQSIPSLEKADDGRGPWERSESEDQTGWGILRGPSVPTGMAFFFLDTGSHGSVSTQQEVLLCSAIRFSRGAW